VRNGSSWWQKSDGISWQFYIIAVITTRYAVGFRALAKAGIRSCIITSIMLLCLGIKIKMFSCFWVGVG